MNPLKAGDIPALESQLDDTCVTHAAVVDVGTALFSAMCGSKPGSVMKSARVDLFSRRNKKTPGIKSLPTTNENLALNISRTHLQVTVCSGRLPTSLATLDICDYGWEIVDGRPSPVISSKDPAPPSLMKVIACKCQSYNAYVSKECSCCAGRISCTIYCTFTALKPYHNPLTQVVSEDEDTGDESQCD